MLRIFNQTIKSGLLILTYLKKSTLLLHSQVTKYCRCEARVRAPQKPVVKVANQQTVTEKGIIEINFAVHNSQGKMHSIMCCLFQIPLSTCFLLKSWHVTLLDWQLQTFFDYSLYSTIWLKHHVDSPKTLASILFVFLLQLVLMDKIVVKWEPTV